MGMAPPLRMLEAEAWYQMLNRGNNRQRVFTDTRYYEQFIEILAKGCASAPDDRTAPEPADAAQTWMHRQLHTQFPTPLGFPDTFVVFHFHCCPVIGQTIPTGCMVV